MKTEIALEGLTFYGYHGFYEEERKSGNRFSVDIKVTIDLPDEVDFDSIENTVNYEDLYQIVVRHMSIPTRLLENLAKKILDDILAKWNNVKYAEVSLNKLSPPIGGPCNKASVTISGSR